MKKAVFTVLFVFLLFLPLETASRLYWVFKNQLSFFAPEPMYIFYPALKAVHKTKITKDDGYFDILFLGGSVIYEAGLWKDTVPFLQENLKPITFLPVRIHNVARPSHSSRDSLFKYKFLADKHFDLVIYYHGINEVRANNCPPEMFRDDYAHYSWYRKLNFFQYYHGFKICTLPYTVYSLWIDIGERSGRLHLVPTDIPRKEWVEYGRDIKSAKPFEQNVQAVLSLAKARNEPVLLSTFAFYVPRDYTYFKFRTKQLDYGKHSFYIEIWGQPEYVMAGILKHNQVLRKLAAENPEVMFVDEFARMPPGKATFDDICHLTDEGTKKLFGDFSAAVVKRY